MKKFLAIFMALLMVVSVLSLAGCKKEEKSKADIFIDAYKSILVPKAMQSFINTDVFSGANGFSFGIDKLSMESMGETVELPEVKLDVFKTGDKSFDVSAALKAGEEKLSALLKVKELKEFDLVLPEAADLYVSGTFSELLGKAEKLAVTLPGEEAEKEVSEDTFKEFMGAIIDALASYKTTWLKDENFTSESVEREIFGEKLTLEKLTLKLDMDDILDVIKTVIENSPEELKAEILKDGKTVDDIIAEVKKEADFEKYEIAFSFFLNDKDVRRIELSGDFAAEGVASSISTSADILNTADTYKEVAETKTVADGEESIMKSSYDLTVKDGKITGKMTTEPTLTQTETTDDEADMLLSMSTVTEFSAEINGTYTDSTFEIEIEGELGMGDMALKLPITVKGETSDKKLNIDIDTTFNLMGVMSFELGMTASVEKAEGNNQLKLDLTEENAVSLDDEEKLAEFGQAVSEYVMGLEGLAEFFGSFGGDEDYDDGYAELVFTAYNDTESLEFYADGTGMVSNYYDLTTDEDAGAFTVTSDGIPLFVITLTGDDTAELNGTVINYEVEDYGDGDVEYYFTAEGDSSAICASPYYEEARLDQAFAYTMTDTTITVNGAELEYTIDEDAGILTLGGVEYSYYSFDGDSKY